MKKIFTLLALFAVASTPVIATQAYAADKPAAAASQYPNKGKVLEVIDTSMYTYMHVTGDKGPIWIAASKTSVAKGANISYPNGAAMTNFYSKTLNRTFDSILFIDKVAVSK